MKTPEKQMKVREPAVAGKFYPRSESALTNQIRNLLSAEAPRIDRSLSGKSIIGGVVPHAGYIYSGYQAVHFFEIVRQVIPPVDTFVICNPNHSGMGAPVALDPHHFWETPLGRVPLDKDFMEELNLPVSEIAHRYEHSAEVMLPMLQHFIPYPFSIVPVSIAGQDFTNAGALAESICKANAKLKKHIMVIASSDFSHYVDPAQGEEKDNIVLEKILKLESEQVYAMVKKHHISVCGYGPIMTLMEYAKRVTANPEVRVLRRGHSGEVIPSREVVDYITILFYR